MDRSYFFEFLDTDVKSNPIVQIMVEDLERFSDQEKKWKEVVGKASFVKNPDQGFLKVSFFGPFYGSYIILELDHQNYSYALVCGPDRSYLWILARSPKIDDATKNALITKAASLGFKTDELIFVPHD